VTSRELTKLSREWQSRLQLKDWRISTRFARANDLGEGCCGECSTIQNLRQATIKILAPLDLHTVDEINRDIEGTLVHEMLHIHLWPWNDAIDTLKLPDTQMEQTVEALAVAFIKLKRGEK
jgi:hypothetical protein